MTEEKSLYDISVQRNSDFKTTFGSAMGLRALEYISDFCLEHDCTFDKESARKSDFNQGARSVILEIRHWLNVDVTKLEKEQTCQNQD